MKTIITLLVAMVTAAICFSCCNSQSTAKQGEKDSVVVDKHTMEVGIPFHGEKGSVGVALDLGLPSGTLWADRNVGASSPEDYGNYFAWGETSTKSNYDWSTYKYANGAPNKLTKYCGMSKFGNNGYTDSRTTLERSDDAATANWGSDWCMPTQQQFQELKDNCAWTWTKRNGKDGYEVKGKNGNSIFLPAAGDRIGSGFESAGWGHYWLSSFCPSSGCQLVFNSGGVNFHNGAWRSNGFSVRPVRCR